MQITVYRLKRKFVLENFSVEKEEKRSPSANDRIVSCTI